MIPKIKRRDAKIMEMNVEKLITELQKIEDKNQLVYVFAGEWTIDFDVIQDSDNSIRLDKEY
jgi:tyrosyl-tRNA synthetase